MAASNPNQLDELKKKVAQERTKRQEALARLKRTVARTVEDAGCPDTPSSTNIKKAPEMVRHTPDPEALETAQEARKNGLSRLKQTTMRACTQVRDTVFMDSRSLASRLTAADAESDTGPTPAGT